MSVGCSTMYCLVCFYPVMKKVLHKCTTTTTMSLQRNIVSSIIKVTVKQTLDVSLREAVTDPKMMKPSTPLSIALYSLNTVLVSGRGGVLCEGVLGGCRV